MADDLGYGDLSCYPDGKLKTPCSDALAKNGMVFTDAHSPSSVCTPTRYGVLTGRYCWRGRLKNGVLWSAYDRLLIEKDRKTTGHLLKDSGYRTAQIGKWHLGWGDVEPVDFSGGTLGRGPRDLGFDYSFVTAGAQNIGPIVFVENQKLASKLKPMDYFTYDPKVRGNAEEHPKWKKFNSWWDRVNGSKGPQLVAEDWEPYRVDEIFTEKSVNFIQNHCKNHKDQPFYLHLTTETPHKPNIMPERFRNISKVSDRADHVLMFDWIVGKIVRTVAELGIEKNTLIIVTSDNGAEPDYPGRKQGHRSNGRLKGSKRCLAEGGHRVPFIASWPGTIKAGSTNNQLLCLTDMMATFAAITGYKMKNDMGEDSFNALPSLQGKDGVIRESIIHHSIRGQFGIRHGKWKYYIDTKTSVECLYDMSQDHLEKNNVAQEHPEVIKKLKSLLDKQKKEGRSAPSRQVTDG